MWSAANPPSASPDFLKAPMEPANGVGDPLEGIAIHYNGAAAAAVETRGEGAEFG
jgi:hypothetical protein